MKQYEEIRKNLARKYKEECFFRIESLSEKPREGFSADEDKIEFCKKLPREREAIKKGYNRVLEKIKDIRQRFSTAVTTGSISGSGKIILEYFDKLVLVWGGSVAVESLNYGIDSSCVNEYSTNGDNIADESNTSTSSNTVMAMTLLVDAPVTVESTVPTDLTRKQQKQLPYTIMII